jgi:hypothetical protein
VVRRSAAAAAAMDPDDWFGVWVNADSVRDVSVKNVQAVEEGPFTPGNRRSG